MFRPEIAARTVAASATAVVKASGVGWFLVVPCGLGSSTSTITVYNNGAAASGDILFFQNITTGGVATPNQPMPLPYSNGLWLIIAGTGFAATIYTWPNETNLDW